MVRARNNPSGYYGKLPTVCNHSDVSAAGKNFANPKSSTFTPSRVSMIFCGFKISLSKNAPTESWAGAVKLTDNARHVDVRVRRTVTLALDFPAGIRR